MFCRAELFGSLKMDPRTRHTIGHIPLLLGEAECHDPLFAFIFVVLQMDGRGNPGAIAIYTGEPWALYRILRTCRKLLPPSFPFHWICSYCTTPFVFNRMDYITCGDWSSPFPLRVRRLSLCKTHARHIVPVFNPFYQGPKQFEQEVICCERCSTWYRTSNTGTRCPHGCTVTGFY